MKLEKRELKHAQPMSVLLKKVSTAIIALNILTLFQGFDVFDMFHYGSPWFDKGDKILGVDGFDLQLACISAVVAIIMGLYLVHARLFLALLKVSKLELVAQKKRKRLYFGLIAAFSLISLIHPNVLFHHVIFINGNNSFSFENSTTGVESVYHLNDVACMAQLAKIVPVIYFLIDSLEFNNYDIYRLHQRKGKPHEA